MDTPHESPISSLTATALALGFAFIYVGSLYVFPSTRLLFATNLDKATLGSPQPLDRERAKLAHEKWRDDPEIIKARFMVIGLASAICCAIVSALLWDLSQDVMTGWDLARLTCRYLGLVPGDSILPHLITPLLYLGPLVAMFLGEELPFQRYFSLSLTIDKFTSLVGLRTYFVGPFTEELVFRACVLAVYHLSGSMTSRMVFLSPLTFGVAHAHHAWDTYNRYGRTRSALQRAIQASLFQLLYTTLFGFHAAYLFLRTGSLLPAWSAHAWCNVMGFPMLAWEVRRCRNAFEKTALILAYILGIIGYIYAIPRWTKSEASMYMPVTS